MRRCAAGSSTENPCLEPVAASISEGFALCERHTREYELCGELDEWEWARGRLRAFSELAAQDRNSALTRAMDLAWAECEARIAVLEAERRMVWE